MKNLIALLMLISSPLIAADGPQYHDLEGTGFIWGDHLSESRNDNLDGLSLFIGGEMAQRMYEKMKEPAVYDECIDDGTITKSAGAFSCSLAPTGSFSCDFGVSVREGKLYDSQSC